jgi:hypothetical protein
MRYPYALLLCCLMLFAALEGQSQTTKTFTYTGAFEKYIVPTTGWYLLEVDGAQGGSRGGAEPTKDGGKGSQRKGYVFLNAGDSLQVAVARRVYDPNNDKKNKAGDGGGASSVIKKNGATLVPLIVAAGGGGGGNKTEGGKGYSGTIRATDGWIRGGAVAWDDYKGQGASGAGFYVDGRQPAPPAIYDNDGAYMTTSKSYINGNGSLITWGGGGLHGYKPTVFKPSVGYSIGHPGGGGGGGGYRGGNATIRSSLFIETGLGGDGGFSYMDPSVIDAMTGVIPDGNSIGPDGSVSITFSPGFRAPVPVSDTSAKLTFQHNVFRTYKAPVEGWYLLSAAGAQGGDAGNSSHPGGKGAVVNGYAYLKAGETLRIAVGGQGAKGNVEGNNVGGGGGGGASSIVRIKPDGSFTPILFAAGGGGGAANTQGRPGSLMIQSDPGLGGRALYNDDFWLVNMYKDSPNKDGVGGGGGGGYFSNGQDVSISGSIKWPDYPDSLLAIQSFVTGGEAYTAVQGSDLTLYPYQRGYYDWSLPQQRLGFWTAPRVLTGNVGGYGMIRNDGSCCGGTRGGFGGGGAGGGAHTGANTPKEKDGGGGGGGGWSGGYGANAGEGGGGGNSYVQLDSLSRPAGGQSDANTGDGSVSIRYAPNYQRDSLWLFAENKNLMNILDSFFVPNTGWYLLDVSGGQGGSIDYWDKQGGKGARMTGFVRLQKGDTLLVESGSQGRAGTNAHKSERAGGGGGRSSVVRLRGSNPGNKYEPLLVAGGGGGAGFATDGSHATTFSYGQWSPGGDYYVSGRGGAKGNGGGIGQSFNPGGAGGGFYTDGKAENALLQQGRAFPNLHSGGESGFGGTNGGGGGGGGWSGGGGGWGMSSISAANGKGGGGGGSYLSSKLDLSGCRQYSGYNEGSGKVVITYRADFTPTGEMSFQGGQFRYYVVPTTGWYLLDAGGARGGPASNDSHQGGKGARLQGYTRLKAGDTLRIAVGGMGQKGVNKGNNPSGGGGGGGSSIVRVRNSAAADSTNRYEPLLFAGGGGGAGSGEDGSAGQVVGDGKPAAGKGGVSGGGGGIGEDKNGGAGGAGYLRDGVSHCKGDCNAAYPTPVSYGGQAYLSGNDGGNTYNEGGTGGFGGGASAGPAESGVDGGGGGGGGWSGGGGGWSSDDQSQKHSTGGGGGGSYLAATLNTAGCLAEVGSVSGDGFVKVKYIPDFTDTTFQSFGYKGSFENFIVPKTGVYFMEAKGAQGGPASNESHRGGYGVRMQGRVSLTAGDTLRIAVGGMGRKGENNGNNVSGGGGGGASSIVKVRNSAAAKPGDRYEPLLFAAGGGGGSYYNDGGPGQLSLNGQTTNTGKGGVNGNGGGLGTVTKNGGGGGSGYLTDGGTHCDGNCNGSNVLAYGGQAYLSGNSGGATPRIGGDGGWGGGGEGGSASNTQDFGGGGGGGWSGGAGGDFYYGGGGGSYQAPVMDTAGCLLAADANSGDGQVTIKFLESIPFKYQTGSIQTYTVPVTGFYQLTAAGAQGGSSGFKQGGRGARMQGYVYLQANEKLRILVGGRGGDADVPTTGAFTTGGGGGGATSIVKVNGMSNEPLVFAGGGGGASQDTLGGPGLTTPDGGSSRSSAGGKDGAGGLANPRGTISGGGGGGYLTNGTNSLNTNGVIWANGGKAYLGGLEAVIVPVDGGSGTPVSLIANGGLGGFGGGGQGGPISSIFDGGGGSGGGGGGWSGGGSSQGNLNNTPYVLMPRAAAGGGGGGSHLSPRVVTTALTQTAGQNEGNGFATISGPRTSTETVRSPGTYTWPRNGVTYRSSGLYVWVDSVNAITRTLDLRITMLGTGGNGGLGGPAGGSLMAYPNPSDGQLTLRTPSLDVAAKLEIYSVDGRRVQEYEVPARTTRFHVDLRRHGAGVYVFRMVAEGEDEHIKVIVE